MKAKITTAANIPAATRRAVYRRDGYRCALCDDVRGLQIHHAMPRSVGGSDDEMNLVTLCWRCHAEAHGTFLPERHRAPRTPEELAELRRSLNVRAEHCGIPRRPLRGRRCDMVSVLSPFGGFLQLLVDIGGTDGE